MKKSAFKKIIERAISEEEGAYSLYSKCAGRSKNPTSKEFFTMLAEQEKNHKKNLENLSLQDVSSFDEQKLDQIVTSDFFVDVKIKSDMSPQDVLIFAIKSEGRAIKAYSRLAEAASEPDTIKLFTLLADEELKHKAKLEEAYDNQFYQFF